MRKIPPSATYNEPTVMWRMRHRDGRLAHSVIVPLGQKASVIWFVTDRRVGSRDFDDWSAAMRWSDQICAQYWTMGWRVTD